MESLELVDHFKVKSPNRGAKQIKMSGRIDIYLDVDISRWRRFLSTCRVVVHVNPLYICLGYLCFSFASWLSSADRVMMSETNSALEFHGYGEELSCELTKDSDPELKACVERSAASWMQMRKREMRMLDITVIKAEISSM